PDTVVAVGVAVALVSLLTCTQPFSSLPFVTSTAGSVMVFFAQRGSASGCSLPGVGAFPVKSTSPSMVSAIAAAGTINAAATAMSLGQGISNPLVLVGPRY